MNIIITGATKGIGRALVELFATKGWNVAFCARTASDVEALQRDLQQRFPTQQFLGQAVDMSLKQPVLDFAQNVVNQWKTIDILVNNAGVFTPCRLSDPANESAFIRMMDTNLYSAYYMTQAILPAMQAAQSGHIFNMCSIASFMAYDSYSVSKFALLGFSKVLREELKTQHIRVTAVMPGATLTPSWDGVDLPKERFMQPEDVAATVWHCYELSKHTVVEEIVLRPQLGDI